MTTTMRSLVLLGLVAAAVASAPLVAPDAGAAPPASIRVQGSLTDHSGGTPVPANGSYAMKFSLYPTLVGGSPAASAGPMSVQVQGGLYNADVPFPPSVFDGTSLFLEVSINGETLAPRIPIVSVPYAYQAGLAVTVAPGSVGPDGLAPGAVTADKLGIPCAEGQILVYRSGAWTCGAVVCVAPNGISCYSGPAGTAGVGVCRPGFRPCVDGTGYGPCGGEVLPSAEICDGLDNDCNGVVDIGCGVCGNGLIEPGEGCDDHNAEAGDGCSQACQMEPGYVCSGQPSICVPGCTPGSGTYNCDGTLANGCECHNPCCGTACGPDHSNGLGQTFLDCTPAGTPGDASTYSLALAQEARAAWTVAGTDFAQANFCGIGENAILRQNSTQCATWVYAGSLAGYVRHNTVAGNCLCPTTASPTWY